MPHVIADSQTGAITGPEAAAFAGWWPPSASRFEERIERLRLLLLALYSVTYFATAFHMAAARLFWFDELFMYYISGLNGYRAIWDALARGVDPLPPMMYWSVHLSRSLFGNSEVAVRLPSIAGYWLATLLLYAVVRRRTNAACGFIALLFPFATHACWYACEARPYALLLLFAALSLYCWQRAKDQKHRAVFIILLAFSLGGAIYSHYYGVLLLIPLLAGELVSAVKTGKPDTPVLAGILGSLASLATLWPLIRAAQEYSDGFWTKVNIPALRDSYTQVFVNVPLALPLAIVLAAVAYFLPARSGTTGLHKRRDVPAADLLVSVSFLSLPFFAFVIAATVTNAFWYRYVITMVAGAGTALGLVAYWFRGRHSWVSAIVLFVLAANYAGYVVSRWRTQTFDNQLVPEITALSRRLSRETTLPIVFGNLAYLPAFHYGDAQVRRRAFYLTGERSERALAKLNTVAALNLRDHAAFLREHREFLVLRPPDSLLPELLKSGAQITVYALEGPIAVYRVMLP